MNKKIKISFFALGGIIFLAVAVFLWYRYSHRENLSTKKTVPTDCDQSLGNCTEKKEETTNSSESKDSSTRPEQRPEEKKVLQENTITSSDDSSDPDTISDENSKKFNSNEDEEETTDGISIEIESDDE